MKVVLAIRRFIARRAKPALFVSDNFKSFRSPDVKEFILKHRMKWEFILERSPWWRGAEGSGEWRILQTRHWYH